MKHRRPAAAALARQRDILCAALEELARADYGGLTFERVAARAGVNKTTLYRQWPTKALLVRAALENYAAATSPGPSTGSLRGDLLRVGRMMLDFASSFEGQGLVRLRLLEHPEPELAEMARALHERYTGQLVSMLGESVARGELLPDADPRLLLELLGGALHLRLFVKNDRVDDVIIARLVDVLLHGVAPMRHQNAATRALDRRSAVRPKTRRAKARA
ncbi:MAG TPA: TetR/AcrR family transcriptional regulator [Polyangiaceae bacterium]|jgi:AcrR family transcriptional regulator|nr:TetR/AcrR family transcriptional regulator [Polyangiaceae bacterium]